MKTAKQVVPTARKEKEHPIKAAERKVREYALLLNDAKKNVAAQIKIANSLDLSDIVRSFNDDITDLETGIILVNTIFDYLTEMVRRVDQELYGNIENEVVSVLHKDIKKQLALIVLLSDAAGTVHSSLVDLHRARKGYIRFLVGLLATCFDDETYDFLA